MEQKVQSVKALLKELQSRIFTIVGIPLLLGVNRNVNWSTAHNAMVMLSNHSGKFMIDCPELAKWIQTDMSLSDWSSKHRVRVKFTLIEGSVTHELIEEDVPGEARIPEVIPIPASEVKSVPSESSKERWLRNLEDACVDTKMQKSMLSIIKNDISRVVGRQISEEELIAILISEHRS